LAAFSVESGRSGKRAVTDELTFSSVPNLDQSPKCRTCSVAICSTLEDAQKCDGASSETYSAQVWSGKSVWRRAKTGANKSEAFTRKARGQV